ncbi:MAG: hypothetical protein CMF62_00650 [Magnetococcales bacterium]|nr:hypothetical protein [Magnetococcales bacterium]
MSKYYINQFFMIIILITIIFLIILIQLYRIIRKPVIGICIGKDFSAIFTESNNKVLVTFNTKHKNIDIDGEIINTENSNILLNKKLRGENSLIGKFINIKDNNHLVKLKIGKI